MNIADILSPQAVFHGLKATNKKKLIAELAGHVARIAGLDEGKLFEPLWERDRKTHV